MREIKFRTWDEELKVMEYFGPKFYVDDEYWELNFVPTEEEGETPLFETNQKLILMQYTGLKDKNGKEIYEGDIVKHHDLGIVTFGKFQSSHEGGHSRYHWHIGFYIVDKDGNQAWDKVEEDIGWNEVKVIGNVYKNLELLEKK